MVDIHSHIIFGIDDGSKSFEDSKTMIKQAIDNGIDHIIATPHYNDFITPEFFNQRDENLSKLIGYIQSENLQLTIEAGCEVSFQIDWDNFNFYKQCVIREKYLLIEFSDIEIPDNYLEIIFKIRKKNLVPIVAHPERSYKIQNDYSIIKDLHRMGCLFQLDAGSLKNHFGKSTLKTAETFLKSNVYHFIGSDAHSSKIRNYNVFDGIDTTSFQNNLLIKDIDFEEQSLEFKPSNFFSRLKNKYLR